MTPLQENLRWIINTAPKHIYLDTDQISHCTFPVHWLGNCACQRRFYFCTTPLHYTASASVQQHTDIADETLLTFLDETLSTCDVSIKTTQHIFLTTYCITLTKTYIFTYNTCHKHNLNIS